MSIQSKLLTVGDVMLSAELTPQTKSTTMLKEALELMDQHRLGIVCITTYDSTLEGIITDGDIRRMLNAVQKPIAALFVDDVRDYCTKNYSSINPDASLKSAITLMEELNIWDLPVVDDKKKLKGLLHLHPVLKKLLAINN